MNKQRYFISLVSSIMVFVAVIFTALNDFSLFTDMVIVFLSVVIGQTIANRLFQRFSKQQVSGKTVFITYASMLAVFWTFASIVF
ncbi:hypothetical protein SIL77_00100 [Exiguobacterium profundum]|uniref:hypothetical protein n=1 Tax=Exiguobacterium profundum TaxID=307643 RepID=UPI0029C133AE|nr:hypothetical protein [Exiguobacterium profundum]MDX5979673.1 hypothetical protein [Exiguobacterium profundum]